MSVSGLKILANSMSSGSKLILTTCKSTVSVAVAPELSVTVRVKVSVSFEFTTGVIKLISVELLVSISAIDPDV
jgi:hypothetical protein